MIDIERIDDKLYKSIYGIPRVGNFDEYGMRLKVILEF